MIRLNNAARPAPQEMLNSPGGFAWWYAEVLDEHGNGAVLIWSFGLPFLPGYAQSARQGRPEMPADRPALNVALYRGGKPELYLLREFAAADVSWDGAGRWQYGESRIEQQISEDGLRLDAHLKLSTPGDHRESGNGKFEARFRLFGPVPSAGDAEGAIWDSQVEVSPSSQAPHWWAPLVGPAFGTVMATSSNSFRFSAAGRAYHDRNEGTLPFHELGIERWLWGHASLPHCERIFYALWPNNHAGLPECVAVEIDRNGKMQVLRGAQVTLPRDRHTLYGMTTWDWVDVSVDGQPWLRLELEQRVDNGPFYLRYLARAKGPGGEGAGSAEVIAPHRIDLDRHRFLVKMRVDSAHRCNSMWLPLFQGPREGRIRRLLQNLRPPRVRVDQRQVA